MTTKIAIELNDLMRLVNLLSAMKTKCINKAVGNPPQGDDPIKPSDYKLGLIKTSTLEAITNDLDEIIEDILNKWEKQLDEKV